MIKSPHLLRPQWPVPAKIEAYSTTRKGGNSAGEYSGFNVGDHVGDISSQVIANRKQLPYYKNINWLEQIHSNTVIELPADTLVGDAAYTSNVGIACAVMTADCVPILMSDRQGTTIAAIHAGLKGLRTQIIQRTIESAFLATEGRELLAWIGPHIGPRCYEVSTEDTRAFSHIEGVVLSSDAPGKALLDLETIARFQLQEMGVTAVFSTGHCTYSREYEYFSYRRARHQGMANCGRMVSVIIKHA